VLNSAAILSPPSSIPSMWCRCFALEVLKRNALFRDHSEVVQPIVLLWSGEEVLKVRGHRHACLHVEKDTSFYIAS
jgi:hypothetical protein